MAANACNDARSVGRFSVPTPHPQNNGAGADQNHFNTVTLDRSDLLGQRSQMRHPRLHSVGGDDAGTDLDDDTFDGSREFS